jgi:hypothetical protein
MAKTPPRKTRTTAPGKPASVKTATEPGKKLKKEKKNDKVKVVRDSFTMPQPDYDLIAELKEKAAQAGVHAKKSELLRAGLQALSKLSAAQLKRAISGLEKIKTGRPKKT